jgi:hypothetical protein
MIKGNCQSFGIIKNYKQKSMSNFTILKKQNRRLRLFQVRKSYLKIKIQGRLLQDIYRNSICEMAEILKSGICRDHKHYTSFVSISINAKNHQHLLRKFLNKILGLTVAQNTIFCSINIHELTNTKLVAQVYGVWVSEFDDEIITFKEDNCLIQEDTFKDSWGGLLHFEVKK